MSSEEVTQIKIGRDRVGIIGLKLVLAEVAETCASKSDDEICTILLERLGKRNYLPEPAKEEYGKAFLNEFKKFAGRPVNESEFGMLEVKVLGRGCARCNQLERDLMAVMTEMDMPADIEHVTDIAEIGSYGVMGTPALVINGEIKSVGSIPSKIQLKTWLTQAYTQK
jgi:small redox-active disulfide protein 2